MTITAASLAVEFSAEGVQATQRAMSGVEQQANRMGAGFSERMASMSAAATRFGGIMSVAATAPLTLFGKNALAASSDLSEAMSAVETVFGRTAGTVLRFSENAARSLGVSREAALSSAGSLGALFKGVGLGKRQMADFSTQLLTTAADLGSFYNVDPGEAMQSLRSGLIGEAEPLRRFGILLTEAATKAKGLELGLGDANGELSEGEKVQARYALILEQVGAAQGDFARTSDGLANSERILRAEIADLSADLGGILLPYAQRGVAIFRQLVGWVRDLSPEAQRLAVMVGAVTAAAGPGLLVLGQVLGVVSKLGPAIALLTGPLGLVVAGVAALGLAWRNNWGGIQEITGRALGWLQGTFGRMIQFFQAARSRGLEPFRLAMRTLIVTLGERLGRDNPIVRFLQQVLRVSERVAGSLQRGDIGGAIAQMARAGRRALGAARDLGGQIAGAVWAGVQGRWPAVQGWFAGTALPLLLSGLGRAMTIVPRTGWQLVQSLWQGAQERWPAFSAWLTGTALPRLWSVLTGAVGQARAAIAPVVGGLVAGFRERFPDLLAWLSGDGLPQLVSRLVMGGGELIGGLAQGLWEHRQEIFDFFTGTLLPGIVALMAVGPTLLVAAGVGIIRGLLGGARTVWETQLGPWLRERGPAVQAWFQNAADWLLGAGQRASDGLLRGFQEVWDARVWPWLSGLPQQILDLFAGLPGRMMEVGGNIASGLGTGIQNAWNEHVANPLAGLVGGLPVIGNKAIDASSPAKKMMPVGVNAIDGILAGAERRMPELASALAGGMGRVTARMLSALPDDQRFPLGQRLAAAGQLPRAPRGQQWASDFSLVGDAFYRRAGGTGGGDPAWRQWLTGQSRPTREAVRTARAAGTAGGDFGAAQRAALMRGVPAGTRAAPVVNAQITVNGVQNPTEIARQIAHELSVAMGRQMAGMGI